MSANQFPVWTCSLLMKFSQLLVPSHSSSVWEYNYTQNAYSSLCLPAAYSVRCISHEAEEMRSLCLYLSICQSAWMSVCLPLKLSWIRQQVTWRAGDHHPITKKKLEKSSSVVSSYFFLLPPLLYSFYATLLFKNIDFHTAWKCMENGPILTCYLKFLIFVLKFKFHIQATNSECWKYMHWHLFG